ncbi:hypothetical protein YC2023_033006 [Brassica napus]
MQHVGMRQRSIYDQLENECVYKMYLSKMRFVVMRQRSIYDQLENECVYKMYLSKMRVHIQIHSHIHNSFSQRIKHYESVN